MPFGLTYRMKWKDVEDQLMIVNIWDRLSDTGGPRPYNIAYTVEPILGLIAVAFTFDALPAGTTGVTIRRVLEGTTQDASVDYPAASPITFVTRNYPWHFYFIIHGSGPDEVIDMNVVYPQIVEMTPSGHPWELSVVDNDEDKLAPIRAKQAVIRVLSDQNFKLSNFCGPNNYDNRYYVTAERGEGKFIFKGYLILEDNSEPFLAPSYEMVLKATDRLGTLKGVPLTKPDGSNPTGMNRIADYLSWVLKKTGLDLPLNVVMNIREESSAPFITDVVFDEPARFIVPNSPFWQIGKTISISNTVSNNVTGTIIQIVGPIVTGPHTGKYFVYFDDAITPTTPETADDVRFEDVGGHLYNSMYLDAKTFEKLIGESEDGYTVISKLMGKQCYLTQERGQWWIKRIDEVSEAPVYVTQFDSEGVFISDNPSTGFPKDIKRDLAINHVGKQTTVETTRPYKFVKETFRYEFPKEIVCNIDFSRGDVITAPDLNAATSEGTYQVECWIIRDRFGVVNSTHFIRRKFEYGYEKERFLVITPSPDRRANFVEAEPVLVKQKDKGTVSFDYRRSADIGPSEGNVGHWIAKIYIIDNEGKYWYWYDPTTPSVFKWVGPYDELLDFNIVEWWIQSDVDEREWRNFSYELAAFPIDGKIYFGLYQQNQAANFNDNYEVHYSNFQFDYSPYINGSYRKYNGHSFKVTQPGEYINSRDEQVYISDAPNKLFKGAMFKKTGDDVYELVSRFFDRSLHPDEVIADEDLHPFGYFQIWDSFNQHNRVFRIFRSYLHGLSAGALDEYGRSDMPGLLHHYKNKDNSPHGSDNKTFQLLSFRQDIDSAKWNGVFKEVFDSNEPKVYNREYLDFKYVE